MPSSRNAGQAAPLGSYRSKRDFARTGEPVGGGAGDAAATAPRFVIQEHHASRLHWDLRLERDGVLASWAIPNGLPETPKDNRFAAATEDHPLEYVDFEGDIPKGQYGAGSMTIWDRGTYECLKWEPRKIEVALHGERLEGRYALFAIGKEDQPKDWMIHRMDPPADPHREPMPERLTPMLARAGELPPEDGRWGYEIKWDGDAGDRLLRAGAAAAGDAATLQRHHRRLPRAAHGCSGSWARAAPCWTARSWRSTTTAGRASSACRRACTSAPRRRSAALAKSTPVTYMIFDLL